MSASAASGEQWKWREPQAKLSPAAVAQAALWHLLRAARVLTIVGRTVRTQLAKPSSCLSDRRRPVAYRLHAAHGICQHYGHFELSDPNWSDLLLTEARVGNFPR